MRQGHAPWCPVAKAASSTAVCTCGYQGPRREEREERPCEPEAKQVSKESVESISKSPRRASQLFQSEPQKAEHLDERSIERDLLGMCLCVALDEAPEATPEAPVLEESPQQAEEEAGTPHHEGTDNCPTFIQLSFASMRRAYLRLPSSSSSEEVDCQSDDAQEEMGQSDDQEEIGQSDAQEEIGQSDAQEEMGQSDDQEEIGQSDAQEEIGQSDAPEEIGQSDEDTLEEMGQSDEDTLEEMGQSVEDTLEAVKKPSAKWEGFGCEGEIW